MCKLFWSVFACLAIVVLVPSQWIDHGKEDAFERNYFVYARQLAEAASLMNGHSERLIGAFEKELGSPLPEEGVRDARKRNAEKKRLTLQAIAEHHKLEALLWEHASRLGFLSKFQKRVTFSLLLALVLSLGCVAGIFFFTVKWFKDGRTARIVARTLLRSNGVNDARIPRYELLQVLQLIGVCRWHCAQMNNLLGMRQIPSRAKSLVGLLQVTASRLSGMFDCSGIPVIPPKKMELREELVLNALRKDALAFAQERVGNEVLQVKLQRQALAEDRQALAVRALQLEKGEAEIAAQREVLLRQEQSIARDRDRAVIMLDEMCRLRMNAKEFCLRIQAGVEYLHDHLSKMGEGSSAPDAQAVVRLLSRAMGIVEQCEQPMYII